MSHTKGPWKLGEDFTIYGPKMRHVVDLYRYSPTSVEEDNANGRLIVAAPEMLNALEFIMEHFVLYCKKNNPEKKNIDTYIQVYLEIKEIVQKAKGTL